MGRESPKAGIGGRTQQAGTLVAAIAMSSSSLLVVLNEEMETLNSALPAELRTETVKNDQT